MSRGIALASMPAMFRDAVIVAHRLGFSYLWIDSLCILQDCPDDWDRESGAMGEIYRRAAITIAAASAPNSHTGLLSVPPQASKELDPPCQLKLHANSDSRDTVSLTRVDWREEDLFFCLFDAPLAKRSWTLQERLLSHRTLYFGKRQIYWECQGGHHAADGEQDSPVIESFFVNFLSLTTLWATSNYIVAHSEARGDDIYNLWHSVLSLYCDNRELTFEKDKFPALSGLASYIHQLTNDIYLAGLWRNDLHLGLLWKSWSKTRPTKAFRAPSWSWASCEGEIHFARPFYRRVATLDDAEFITCDIGLVQQNPFGEVKSGRLRVKGRTQSLFRSERQYDKSVPLAGLYYFDLSQVIMITIGAQLSSNCLKMLVIAY
ncbi:HET-domain-containing protein [Hyaloscypha bicolor E]|uniref:HET-domain-containing protein n=1 Tax=Hyaloscypha bicolor E TaxID=1095630 RepID=A0A2J6TGK1_9HELO|nr:HET-domain-containing protein [Hyaloscypha bicolor E]PMD62166.1 HET-domain-containing protein [Hyaloscypha bicolor E]